MSKVRVLIADRHYLVRLGLRSLIESQDGYEICGEAVDGTEVVEKCKQLNPDLLILDICMPKLSGVNASRQILKAKPKQKILIVTDVESEDVIGECVAFGISGWVWKSDGAVDLLLAIKAAHNNRTFFTPSVAQLVRDGYLRSRHRHPAVPTVPRLTSRQRELVQLIGEGSSTKEAASILRIAVKTVETHRSNIMQKLGIHSISELVLYAVRNNIVRVQLLTAPPLAEGIN